MKNKSLKKYSLFYISNHGFGHLTRCLAQIEDILNNTDNNIYIACGKKQNDFARIYLKNYKQRIIYSDIKTDIGFINKPNSLEVDKEKLTEELYKFIEDIDDLVNSEIKKIQELSFDSIYVDISPVGILVGKKLNKKVIITTNFTWYSQYKYLNLDNKLLDFYRRLDLQIDQLRKFPLYFDLDHIKCQSQDIDFICRKIEPLKVRKIQKQFGQSIYISLGKSANIDEIKLSGFEGTVFYTEGLEIKTDANLVQLPVDILDTQNYIAASDFVITKAGWGTIAECITSNVPMLLIERPTAIEDTNNIKKIINMKKGLSITEEQLKNIEVNDYEQRLKDLCSRS